ncbi:MAG: hypothetical protein MUF34_16225 [Polyangiaceae bacterium]|nr:hypothetical protein [Polyangiaceae bacterium]
MSGFGVGRRVLLAASVGAAALALAAPASAATWAGGRSTPSLREIVALDATGEPGWPYGAEDLAGDGATFDAPEQSVDVRSGYAAVDATRLFLRAYFSSTADLPGPGVGLFVFIDSDGNATTGGKATAPEISGSFTNDPSPGGYEYVVGVRGPGTLIGIWQWNELQVAYSQVAMPAATAEAGRDVDPLRVGEARRAYAQASVEPAAVGVTATCLSNFFFRSTNEAPGATGAGPGDRDVGVRGACVPADANADGVPDLVAPPPGCRDDDQCANQGVCVEGRCVLAAPCSVTAECTGGRQCTPDGRCVVPGGDACTTSDQCEGAICRGGTCAACTPGGNECGAGRRCGPAGTCVEGAAGGGGAGGGGPGLVPGGQVEGGAFNCSGSASGNGGAAAPFAALLLALAGAKRAARRRVDNRSN